MTGIDRSEMQGHPSRRGAVLARLDARSAIAATRVAACFACAATPVLGHCQIYAGTSDASGAVVLSSFATKEASTLLIAAPPRPELAVVAASAAPRGRAADSRRAIAADLHGLIETAASRATISPQLIHAVIDAESHYEPKAVSNRGAIGLMQLLPSTAKRFGADDPFDPAQNIAAGAAYLKWLMGFFGNDLELVLAGYNAGEQAVVRAGRKIPPYAETQAYVRRVMATLQRADPAAL
ncbi:MAG: lytic transglycosylase domain-containing protein [Caldimonas sp.]